MASAGPSAFEIGRSPSGHRLLFTNVPQVEATNLDIQIPIPSNELVPERLVKGPTISYVDKVFDPDRFSESFATALTWLLASMLAPALVKGEEGEVVATRCLQRASGFVRSEASHETATQPVGALPNRHLSPLTKLPGRRRPRSARTHSATP